MKIKNVVSKLENSLEYKRWRESFNTSSLVHIFKMFDEANKDECQIGYYNSDDKITTFIVCQDGVQMLPEAEVFKKPDAKIMKLSVDDIKIDLDDAMDIGRRFQEKKYPKEKGIKEIVILQRLEIGTVYNITFVTQAFNTLNIKVDAKTGKVVKHKLMSLMDLKTDS